MLGLEAEQLHGDLGDEAQRTLVADHHVPDVGAGGAPRDVLDPGDGAVREHRLQPDDHVLDPAVERRELADRAGRDQSAHLGERLGLRRVAGGQALLAQGVLEHLQRYAALGRGHHVHRVDLQDPVHPRAVEHDRVRDRRSRARPRWRCGRSAARRSGRARRRTSARRRRRPPSRRTRSRRGTGRRRCRARSGTS